MSILEQVKRIQIIADIPYKEARYLIKAHLRQQFEKGELSKHEWKEAKRILQEELK